MSPRPRFQALTVKFNGLAGEILTDAEVYPAYDPNKPRPTGFPVFKTMALWDTGASKSVISPAVVAHLGLRPVGRVEVHHAGGKSFSPTYLVNVRLPHNDVVFGGAIVTEFSALAGKFEAIIGMDIIGIGDFSITNVGGKTCMSFRTPSCAQVDYVADFNRQLFAGVGRNDPCPCGKKSADGRPVKFKDCHAPTLSRS